MYFHLFSDYDEMMTRLREFEKHISSVLVRFSDNDVLQVIDVDNVEEFCVDQPNNRSDFEALKCYNARLKDDEEFKNVQILKMGCESWHFYYYDYSIVYVF